MKLSAALIALSSLAIPSRIAAQTTDPDQTPTANTPQTPLSPAVSQPAPAFDRPVSWKLIVPNLLSDQKHIWTFPVRLAEGKDWIPTAAVLGATAGLLGLDPVEAGYFRRTTTFHGFNNIFTSNATIIGTIVAPVSLYAAGLIRKDSKMQRTALLAGEAIADAEILTTVLKDATARARPSAIPATSNFSDSWLDASGARLRSTGGFPSGHTIAAFSVATVVARRYGNHRWVPYAAYGMAALVGFSRLTLSAHYLSDVFVGGVFGYAISRFTVLRQ